jgi:hypothetical protein
LAPTVYLISPASLSGRRAAFLLDPDSRSALALRLRSPTGAPLGEIFAFISALYFRGKLSYAEHHARPPRGCPGTLVITSDRGLVPADERVTLSGLRRMAGVPIDADEPRYRRPLDATSRRLAAALGTRGRAVLLGSIASDKYVPALIEAFGSRLLFPAEFVGRGDMSRGSLLLRLVGRNERLAYVTPSPSARPGSDRGSRPRRSAPARSRS